ncbi:hypothetical protein WICPIJ_007604 [Wickerhamomyces pijperi]|uniref:Uncharacterized protein n=1 Tax=Wickerhamomyces pijperi TaxID=599730 RepID=A0A9P8Q1J0_WICPI|nr:hypothetical protein WICPIJ_007604 [Wickerhamomyces pijperi]
MFAVVAEHSSVALVRVVVVGQTIDCRGAVGLGLHRIVVWLEAVVDNLSRFVSEVEDRLMALSVLDNAVVLVVTESTALEQDDSNLVMAELAAVAVGETHCCSCTARKKIAKRRLISLVAKMENWRKTLVAHYPKS